MAGIDRLIVSFTPVFAIAGFVAAYSLCRSIVNPVNKVAGTLRDISEGEGNLTKRVSLKNASAGGEIGDLARRFNLTIEQIKNFVLSIRKKAAILSRARTGLASHMTETAASITEITAATKTPLPRPPTKRQPSKTRARSWSKS